jgi:beta-carotene ketolase (CrtO type)
VRQHSSSLRFSIEYDAIVVGAGHNGLTCGCYLARAGLRVLVLEEYHSIGGMTITEEITLPGFKSDIHAFGYQLANASPVPKELGLDRFGFELIHPEILFSHIFPNGRYISMFRSLEKTLKSIEKFSVKDARAWYNLFNKYLLAREKIFSSINSPPVERIPAAEEYRNQLQSMRSWCDEYFESDEAKVVFGTFAAFVGLAPDDAGGGEVCHLFASIAQDKGNNVVRGGFGNLPKALARYIESKGGVIMTNASVTKIIIENNKAIGVSLANGKNILAKRLVVSSIDPSTLILKLIGQDHVDSTIVNSIKRFEWGDSVVGIYLALDGRPKYKSDQEVASSSQIHISSPTLENFSKTSYECRSGMIPSNPPSIMSNESIMDPSRVPPQAHGTNKHLVKVLVLSVPYDIKNYGINNNTNNMDTNTDWFDIKEQYSDQIIDTITEDYIPNLKEIVLKKVTYSPVDYEKRPTTCIRGTLSCGAVLPYQSGSMRPIPQLSNYKIPSLQNVYLCGSGNYPGPGVSMAPGRNAAQVILRDLGINFNRLEG